MARRILVTAGASGIGLEFVRAFAARRDTIFVCDINAQALDDLTKEIPGIITKVCEVFRLVKVEGDLLHLSSALPIMSGGKKVNSKLV